MTLIFDASTLYAQADASLIVLAYRYHTRRGLTLDERGFRAVTPL